MEIDFEQVTEDELQKRVNRRLDRQISDVFYVTQSFFKFHNEVLDNLEQLKIERVSKNFA